MIGKPVEAAIVLGGAWGIFMFLVGWVVWANGSLAMLVLALVLGIGIVGPLSVWRVRRRG
jgi:hypothetical protein